MSAILPNCCCLLFITVLSDPPCFKYIILIVLCRRVVVGEHTLNTSPDCRKSGDFCLPENQTLTVDKTIQHPMWNIEEFDNGYDIALVRVKGHITLFVRFQS